MKNPRRHHFISCVRTEVRMFSYLFPSYLSCDIRWCDPPQHTNDDLRTHQCVLYAPFFTTQVASDPESLHYDGIYNVSTVVHPTVRRINQWTLLHLRVFSSTRYLCVTVFVFCTHPYLYYSVCLCVILVHVYIHVCIYMEGYHILLYI